MNFLSILIFLWQNINFQHFEIFCHFSTHVFFTMHSQCWIQYKNDFIDDDNCSRQQSNSWPSIKNVQYRYGVCQYLQLNLQEINEEKICLSFYKFRKRSFKLISNFFTVTLSCQKMTTIRYSTTKAISCVRHKVKTIFFNFFCFCYITWCLFVHCVRLLEGWLQDALLVA